MPQPLLLRSSEARWGRLRTFPVRVCSDSTYVGGTSSLRLSFAILYGAPDKGPDGRDDDHGDKHAENEKRDIRHRSPQFNKSAPSERIEGTHIPTNNPCSRAPLNQSSTEAKNESSAADTSSHFAIVRFCIVLIPFSTGPAQRIPLAAGGSGGALRGPSPKCSTCTNSVPLEVRGYWGGSSTASITWMIPLLASMSVATICASSM